MEKPKGKILVLDDERIVLDSVSRILDNQHYEVKTARKGEDAIEILKEGGFDILLTDLKMPGINGLQAMESLSEIDPDLSMIMFTAYSTIDSAVEALKLGAVDYIRKPFTPDQLLDLVNKTMKDRKARFEKRYREDTFEELKKAISSTLNLKEVLDLIVQGVVKVMKVRGSTLSLLDKNRENLRVFAHNGLSTEYVCKGPLDSSKSIGETILKGKHAWVEDVATDPRIQYPNEAIREGIKSILSVPLIVRNKVLGVLRVYTGEVRAFSDEELKFLYGFAELVAYAIENARSYEDVKDECEALRDDLWDSFDKQGLL
ncbi:response regulator [Desulfomonile tiedjei]|uniref:Response regulator with CheY-like receiver, AAA-type ATPase, and DNA-binding domains n=1 Tax=Desulfomonile tiedjei (strain ATCC 49306 / DSM 6799 / DCB-1) TaxID=706587 RepID=I4C7R1_DESTA|nr:response regulator [Desulfomonile tiedjei]AFM25602.1 response regulator with CheY-like receiver, AAA-type ATPase, and DNA-binding domains [Desulfomonile tiedjei DSM 6799]